jgi:hypothetical protein
MNVGQVMLNLFFGAPGQKSLSQSSVGPNPGDNDFANYVFTLLLGRAPNWSAGSPDQPILSKLNNTTLGRKNLFQAVIATNEFVNSHSFLETGPY